METLHSVKELPPFSNSQAGVETWIQKREHTHAVEWRGDETRSREVSRQEVEGNSGADNSEWKELAHEVSPEIVQVGGRELLNGERSEESEGAYRERGYGRSTEGELSNVIETDEEGDKPEWGED
jgi:hypothetical protein